MAPLPTHGQRLDDMSSEWEKKLAKLRERRSAGIDPIKAGLQPSGQLSSTSQTANRNPYAITPVTAGFQGSSTPDSNTYTAARDTVTPASTTNGTGSGTISDNYDNIPGKYYSDVISGELGSVRSDPSMAARYYAKDAGMGNNTAEMLSSQYDIPNLLKAMGISGDQLSSDPKALDWMGRIWDRLSGKITGDGGSGYYLDPSSIIQGVFNTPLGTNANASSLAYQINNPSMQPEEQIMNVTDFLMSSLKGVVPSQTLNSYADWISNAAFDYQQIVQTTAGGRDSAGTFLNFLRQRGGASGGLF